MDKKEYALKKHEEWQGKLEIALRCDIENSEDLGSRIRRGLPSLAWQYPKIPTLAINIQEEVTSLPWLLTAVLFLVSET